MADREVDQALAMDLFLSEGPMSLGTWTRLCIQRGVFSDEFEATALFREGRRRLKQIASEKDARGLPQLGQTCATEPGTGEPIYDQPDLWERDTWLLQIKTRLTMRDANHEQAKHFINFYEARFGEPCPLRPSLERVEELAYDDDAAAVDF